MRTVVSRSGWQEQPAIKDMARIQFGHSTCQIEGTYVPTADFNLAGDDSIYFSHHTLLWVEPTVAHEAMSMAGGWNRVRAGLPLVMLEARGPGHMALSDDAPGEVIALPLQHGQAVWVREHRFLAATGNVAYTWQQSGIWIVTGSGDDRETHYPLGMYVDIFHAEGGPGLLLLHSPGNIFIRDLAQGETICIQPGALVYKDPSVGMQLHIEYPNAGRLVTGIAATATARCGCACGGRAAWPSSPCSSGPRRATRSPATRRRRPRRGSVSAVDDLSRLPDSFF